MHLSVSKRVLALLLSLACVLSLTTTAFAQDSVVPSNLLFNSQEMELPEYDTTLREDDMIQDETEPEEEAPVTRNQTTMYRFMKMWNSVLTFSSSISTYTNAIPISLRIESKIKVQERVPTPPLINQCDYPKDPYGKYGSIASHGCGIACLTMAASYLLDEELDVVEMADQFGHYNTERGSYWILFEDSAQILGLPLQERTYDTDVVMEALRNGQIVIALQSEGLFTSGGHFILLTGLTEDGKITVNDPNGNNWNKNRTLRKGFAEGFTEKQVFANGGPYWIYDVKQVKIDTLDDERVTVTYKLHVNN